MLKGMCIKMSEGIVEERLRWVKPIVAGEIKLKDVDLVNVMEVQPPSFNTATT